MSGLNAVDMPILAFVLSITFVGMFTIYFWIVFSRLLATTTHS
jgi:TRAP-type C4-dicarboxylate transport system permease small subunit